jgi:hypothetical protein
MSNIYLHGALRFVACLVLVGIACWPSSARGAEDSCRLTSDQKMKAVKAFKALSPIFQDQRCLNCHGAVNPFTVDGGHAGETVDIVQEAKKFLAQSDPGTGLIDSTGPRAARELQGIREIADSDVEISDIDLIRLKAQVPMQTKCRECHVSKWDLPLRHNHFAGRSWKQICVHMKTSDFTDDPVAFLRHMQDDAQVLLGFKGQRGLLQPPRAVPPAMSFDTMARHANDWVAAMGGEFYQPAECGCEVDGLALRFEHRIVTNPESGSSQAGFAQFDGLVEFNVLLEEIAPGWYQADDFIVRRPVEVKHVRPSHAQCSGTGWRDERWRVSARLDEKRESMEVRMAFFEEDEEASWTCTQPGYSTTDEVNIDLHSTLKTLTMPIADSSVGEGIAHNEKLVERVFVSVIDSSVVGK